MSDSITKTTEDTPTAPGTELVEGSTIEVDAVDEAEQAETAEDVAPLVEHQVD